MQIEYLNQKVADNLKTEQNEEGLLRRAKSDYESCLKVDVDAFRTLLDQDVDDCKKELEQTQAESQKIADSTAKFLA